MEIEESLSVMRANAKLRRLWASAAPLTLLSCSSLAPVSPQWLSELVPELLQLEDEHRNIFNSLAKSSTSCLREHIHKGTAERQKEAELISFLVPI